MLSIVTQILESGNETALTYVSPWLFRTLSIVSESSTGNETSNNSVVVGRSQGVRFAQRVALHEGVVAQLERADAQRSGALAADVFQQTLRKGPRRPKFLFNFELGLEFCHSLSLSRKETSLSDEDQR